MTTKRAIFRVQLDPSAKQNLEDLCHHRGMTQIAVMSRLITWFTCQTDVIQAAILGQLTESNLALIARQILQQMANSRAPST